MMMVITKHQFTLSREQYTYDVPVWTVHLLVWNVRGQNLGVRPDAPGDLYQILKYVTVTVLSTWHG